MTGADRLADRLGGCKPEAAIILGSSLGAVADAIEDALIVPYTELAGFPVPSVSGHAGRAVAGRLGRTPVLALQGRAHAYEHGHAGAMRPVIEALHHAGIGTLILTNAAGSLRPDIRPGRLMLITDHINLAGMNPLIGEAGDAGFVSMTGAYDAALAARIREAARAEALPLAEGVYVWFSGPSFETPAEIRMARLLGGDAVGMSTVPEAIVARRFNLRVAALAAITNLAAGLEGSSPSHAETTAQGAGIVGDMTRLLARLFSADA